MAAVARKLGISKFALHRHMKAHITDERMAALAMGRVQREALAAQIAEESSSVLDHHKVVRAGLLQTYSAVLDAGDALAVGLLAGRLTQVNIAIGTLTGELAKSPLVQNNTINNNFGETVDYGRLKLALEAFGHAHPDVFPALCDVLATLDAPAPEGGLLLEHQQHERAQ